jgi:tetratricopeptide (TPR) repeat protein
MNPSKSNKPKEFLSRELFLKILNAGLESGSFSFTVRAATIWTSVYPGDLEINYLLAKACLGAGYTERGQQALENICRIDPEYIDAQETLANLELPQKAQSPIDALSCVYAMGRPIKTDFKIPEWTFLYRSAWQAYLGNQFSIADELIRQVIVQKPDLPLAAILHLRIAAARKDNISLYQLASIYRTRWPDCLQFSLYLANAMMEMGQESKAVNLLHECVTKDPQGVVARRVLGNKHPYLSMWPESFEIKFDLPIPAPVAAYMGWNTLPAGEPVKATSEEKKTVQPGTEEYYQKYGPAASFMAKSDVEKEATEPKEMDEQVESVKEVFDKLSKRLNKAGVTRSDGRFPLMIVLSTKSGLIKKYGRQTYAVLDSELKNLADAVSQRPDWGAGVFYPDDPGSTVKFGLSAIDTVDPWKIKLAITDLDKALSKKGEMIGALLIIGGKDIVPFHMLPNPTDDMDDEIPSDNPYGTLDGNYFVTEWPVGRFPDGSGSDAGLLLSQIRSAAQNHAQKPRENPWWVRLLNIFGLLRNLQASPRSIRSKKGLSNLGFSAAIWQRSSIAAFRPIGDGKSFMTSPPEESGKYNPARISSSQMGYFNLHGLVDSPNWYGQRDVSDTSSGEDYPIALCPKDLVKNGEPPKAVFSEACYGAHIFDKSEEESLALKFLGIGTGVFAGSTCISYGSIDTPLIGADLLASVFWKFVKEGLSVGEAMMKARIELIREMNRRQGFLDGEDQKTLISFVLYGDPLLNITQQQTGSKGAVRADIPQSVMTMHDCENQLKAGNEIPIEKILEVKKIVESYLPGLDDSSMNIHQQQLFMSAVETPGNVSESEVVHSQKVMEDTGGQVVITFKKTVQSAKNVHHHYVRAKVDNNGKVIKLAVSR